MRTDASYWRYGAALGVTAVMSAALISAALILSGWFDPQPVGTLQSGWATAVQTAAPLSEAIDWLPGALPAPPFTLRLTAAPISGARDIGYGLILAGKDSPLVTAVSPLGYAAVWQTTNGDQETLRPWQTWPHIRPSTNELWLDVTADQIIIRLNRELYAQLPLTGAPERVGLYVVNFEAGQETTVQFEELSLFSNE